MTRSAFAAVRSPRTLILLASLLATITPQQVLGQKVVAAVESSTIYLGQPFDYEVQVTDGADGQLQPLELEDFTVERRAQPSVQHNMSIIGGAMSSSVVATYSYSLTPQKAGTFVIPAPILKLKSKEIKGQKLEVRVIGPEKSNLFELTCRVDPPAVYPMQRFTVFLEVNLRSLDKPYSIVSPVSSQVTERPPRLTIPWFNNSSLPEAIEELEPLDLRRIQTGGRSGFNINGMRRFSLLTFLPEEEKFTPEVAEGEDRREWFRYTFKRTFFATQPGKFNLGRAALRGQLMRRIEADRGTLAPVFGVSDPVSVEIKPVPLKGRPESWCGVIGDLDVESNIAPTSAKVGEPLTLTLHLSGTGSLSDAFPPDLTTNAAVNSQFRIYDATSKPVPNGRVFTYSLRAKEAGSIRFPAIDLSWFNPLLEKYVTGKTSPIELTITKSAVLAPDNIVGTREAVSGVSPQATAHGLVANIATLDVDRLQAPKWFVAWAGVAIVTALLFAFVGRESSERALRRAEVKRAMSDAETKLVEGLRLWKANDMAEGIRLVREVVNGIVCSVSGSDEYGLTTEEIKPRMESAAFAPALIDRVDQLLKSFDASRYGGLSESHAELRTEAEQTAKQLLTAARRMRLQA